MMIHDMIHSLIVFEINHGLIKPCDYNYINNQIHSLLDLIPCEDSKTRNITYPSEALDCILDYAYENGIITDNSIQTRDIFDSKIMDIFVSKPSEVVNEFNYRYNSSPKDATDWFYNYSQSSNYIRMDRIKKNIMYEYSSKYGKIGITINLSRPEKDPKRIAEELKIQSTSYPKCLLCVENEGFEGDFKRDARNQHRIIPINIDKQEYFFQYSPYIYYNEHTIILNKHHIPMVVDKSTVSNLLTLVDYFDGYFFGSNSSLPRVGGSILSHDHYQGGKHTFPIENAKVLTSYQHGDCIIETLYWPLTVIRIKGENRKCVETLVNKIFTSFVTYENSELGIIPFSSNEPHNTITPIVRKKNNVYEFDVVLRNNRVDDKYPLGIFHNHEEIWNIKKENIGLIEVMGLAILPGRLLSELKEVKKFYLKEPFAEDIIKKHQNIVDGLFDKKDSEIDRNINDLVGKIFIEGLEHCGVFKQTENGQKALNEFIKGCLFHD